MRRIEENTHANPAWRLKAEIISAASSVNLRYSAPATFSGCHTRSAHRNVTPRMRGGRQHRVIMAEALMRLIPQLADVGHLRPRFTQRVSSRIRSSTSPLRTRSRRKTRWASADRCPASSQSERFKKKPKLVR
jgi:hypothetical protein